MKIGSFRGDYDFLSNFYSCPVQYNGLTFKSSEAAFQAAKTLDAEEQKKFTTLNPSQAKSRGRHVNIRADWEDVKYGIMVEILYSKFTINLGLKEKLLSTGDAFLEEGTMWCDNEWGSCKCPKCITIQGQNKLGYALMAVRSMLKISR